MLFNKTDSKHHRQAGLSISQSAQLLGFSHATISRVYKEREKHPACGSPVGDNALVYNGRRPHKNVAWSDESRDIQMVESEFGVNRMRTWIHHALFPLCRLLLVVV